MIFFIFYILPCVALIALLYSDSQAGRNNLFRANNVRQLQPVKRDITLEQLQVREFKAVDAFVSNIPTAESTLIETPAEHSQRMTLPKKQIAIAPSQISKNTGTPVVAYSQHELVGIKGMICLAYLEGYKTVAKYGVANEPQTTLREYSQNAATIVPAISKPLLHLTELTEITLYSDHILDENMATDAERFVASIKKS